ncbi:MAG: hypothetical protein JXA67_06835, partial [Micromonosporaceae bacterium]|nr:hypothetical protein [Micromonosporaceae bacterium]
APDGMVPPPPHRLLGSVMTLFGHGNTQGNHPILAQIQAAYRNGLSGQPIGLVRGRHLIDWVPTLQEWLRDGREDEALELLHDIIEAAEQIAQVDGVAPPSRYTQQAADLYRKRADESGERTILECYAAACPAGTGDPALLDRLAGLRDR